MKLWRREKIGANFAVARPNHTSYGHRAGWVWVKMEKALDLWVEDVSRKHWASARDPRKQVDTQGY